jgi:two-component system KDP operon response regulator KdpE
MLLGLVVLLVAEEPQVTRFLRAAFNQAGAELCECRRAHEAVDVVEARRPALVLLDLRVPGTTHVEATRLLRQHTAVPLLAFSDRVGEQMTIDVLDAGADDYLTLPLSRGEMLARARAMLRRARQPATGRGTETFRLGGLEVDFAAREVKVHGQAVHLTPTEYKLLGVLIRSAGSVVPHERLLTEVWGPGVVDHVQYLRVYMKQLRQKLERAPTEPRYLVTEPAIGYRLRVPSARFDDDGVRRPLPPAAGRHRVS